MNEMKKCQTVSSLIVNASENEKKFSDNEISYNTESNETQLKSNMPGRTQISLLQDEFHMQKNYPIFPESQEGDTHSSFPDLTDLKINTSNATSHAENLLPDKLQEEKHPEQAPPSTASHFYNEVSGVNSSQIHCIGQTLDSSSLAKSGSAQVEIPPGANQQILNIHGYESQQQVCQMQYQQYYQEQSKLGMAISQGEKSGTSPYIHPNLHQQSFHPSYPFQSMVPPSEAQAYSQNAGQYSSFQYGQEFPSQMWNYYYQQQLYHIQLLQQQNLLLQQQNLQMQLKQNIGNTSQPCKTSPLQWDHEQEELNLAHKEYHHQKSKQTQNLELEKQRQSQQNIQHYQSELQTFDAQKQQQQLTSHQLQHQQLQFQKQLEHSHHDHQMQISPLDIQALSKKYLQVRTKSIIKTLHMRDFEKKEDFNFK